MEKFRKNKIICHDNVRRYRIYSNIDKQDLGEIELTLEQRDVLTKAFQHRGMLHQDLALLIIEDENVGRNVK
ncbi:MAG: hypothetical protein J5614_10345 [Paludibacteraceae bacterium]|nr:hypothetical protein [Paludibacteraceae bacterium]